MRTLPRTDAALRMLFAAWYVDGEGLAPWEREWLHQRLADLHWSPTPQECADFGPGLRSWAFQHGLTPLITQILNKD